MWCQNQNMCIDRNAYLVAFPYGQCMDWTTNKDTCFTSEDEDNDLCRDYQTCSECQDNPACGWCDLGSTSGLGKCYEGGASGPLEKRIGRSKHQFKWIKSNVCSVPGYSWHFTSCPECQCNGHSNCTAEPGVCDQPCQHETEGDHCQICRKGYFGNPVNGGKCGKCECNNQGSMCDHKLGHCFLTPRVSQEITVTNVTHRIITLVIPLKALASMILPLIISSPSIFLNLKIVITQQLILRMFQPNQMLM